MLYLGLKLATIEKFVINYFLFQNIIGLFNQMGKMFLFKKTCIYAKMSIALSIILINKIKLMKFISLKKFVKGTRQILVLPVYQKHRSLILYYNESNLPSDFIQRPQYSDCAKVA